MTASGPKSMAWLTPALANEWGVTYDNLHSPGRLLKFGVLPMAATTTGELIGGGGRFGRGIEWGFPSFSSLQTHLRDGRQKLWDPDQIVCDGGEDKEPFDQVAPTMP